MFCMYNCNCFATITFLNYCVQEVTTEQLQYNLILLCWYFHSYNYLIYDITYFDIEILILTDFVLYSKTVLLKISLGSFSVILYYLVHLFFISIQSLTSFIFMYPSLGEASKPTRLFPFKNNTFPTL